MCALVDQWQASGTTKKAFCTEQGINIHTFSYWVGKRRQVAQLSGGFAEVDLSGARPTSPITITFPNGVVISCPANPALIGRLIHLVSCFR